MNIRRTPGFTLVELLVVIAIIAILAAITIPVFLNIDRSGKINACMNNLRKLGVALEEFRQDFGYYPPAPDPRYLQSGGSTPDYMPISPGLPNTPMRYTGVGISGSPEALLTISGTISPPTKFIVKIIAAGTPDSFRYSVDDGNTWLPVAPISIPTDLTDPLNPVYGPVALGTTGISVTFGIDTGHAVNDQWDFWANEQGLMPAQAPKFGMATLYWLYLNDKQDYVRGRNVFHCPSMDDTANVNIRANSTIERSKYSNQQDKALFDFDPLWSGFNTYDVTYNYDQYDDASDPVISTFDTALGFGPQNAERQLKNPKAPPDTVVCWCYGHRSQPGTSFPTADPAAPDITTQALTGNAAQDAVIARENDRLLRNALAGRRSDRDLILWVDGTVAAMRPYLVQAQDTDAAGTHDYYWVPPFLMTPEGGVR